jgi:hypothetical protein
LRRVKPTTVLALVRVSTWQRRGSSVDNAQLRSARGARWVLVVMPLSLLVEPLFDMPLALPAVAFSAPDGMGRVELEPLPVVLPMPVLPELGMAPEFDVALGDLVMSVEPLGIVDGMFREAGGVEVDGVVEVAGVSAGVVPDVVAGVVDGVVMGVDGGVVAEFCAMAKPAPPTTAMTTAEAIKN